VHGAGVKKFAYETVPERSRGRERGLSTGEEDSCSEPRPDWGAGEEELDVGVGEDVDANPVPESLLCC